MLILIIKLIRFLFKIDKNKIILSMTHKQFYSYDPIKLVGTHYLQMLSQKNNYQISNWSELTSSKYTERSIQSLKQLLSEL